MVDRAMFVTGLGALALQLRQSLDRDTLDAYFLALQGETDDAEFSAFIGVAAKRYRWEFFPSVPKLLEALEEFRGSRRVGPDRQLDRGSVENARLSPTACLAQIRERAVSEGLVGSNEPEPGGER